MDPLANAVRCSFPIKILNAFLDMNTGELSEMQHIIVNPKYKKLWGKSYTIEFGRLAQGIPDISKGAETIVFIARDKIPFTRLKDITYGRICVNYCPKKDDLNCKCFTIGGDMSECVFLYSSFVRLCVRFRRVVGNQLAIMVFREGFPYYKYCRTKSKSSHSSN